MRFTGQQGQLVDEATTLLADKVGVRLSGPRLSGRTTILRAVCDLLVERGIPVFQVLSAGALRERPLATLAGSGVPLNPDAGVSQAIDALVEHLAPGTVVAVDDADSLDLASRQTLKVARGLAGFTVLSTGSVRPLRGEPKLLDPQALFLRIPALRCDDVHGLMRRMLGSNVPHLAAVQVAVATGGLAGLVVAYAEEARRVGLLNRGRTNWTNEQDLWLPRLSGLIGSLLEDLDGECVEALSLLSLARPLSVKQAREVIRDDVFLRIERQGLINAAHTQSGLVLGVMPPLLAELLRRELPPAHQLILEQQIAASATREKLAPVAKVTRPKSPLWTVTSPPTTAALVTELFRERRDSALALRRKVWEAKRSPVTALAYVAAIHDMLGDPELAQHVLSSTEPNGDERAEAQLTAWRAMYVGMADHDLAGARQLCREGRRRSPRFAGLLRAIEAHLVFVLDRVPDPELLMDPAPEEDPLSWEAIHTARAEVYAAQGRTHDAREELAAASGECDIFRRSRLITSALVEVIDGHLDDAVDLAARHLDWAREELNLPAAEGLAYAAGLSLALGARSKELRLHVSAVLAFARMPIMQRHFELGLLMFAAIDATQRDNLAYARSLVARASLVGRPSGPFPGMHLGLIDSLVELASCGNSDPLARAREMGKQSEQLLDRGYVVHGVAVALASLSETTSLGISERLRVASRDTQSDALQALVDYASAAEAQDADRMIAVADQLTAFGMHSYAAQVLSAAAARLREAAEHRRAAQTTAALWQTGVDHGLEIQRMVDPLVSSIGLSAREWEVAGLLTEAHCNQAIAKQLAISARTVETHVQNVFRKTGIDTREELTDAMLTWLVRPFPPTLGKAVGA